MSDKVLTLGQLLPLVEQAKAQGQRVVLTNGVFDLLHVGHVRYLKEAKSLGDFLIVGLNSDASAARLKGEGRPILPQEQRAEALSALECVDGVVIFEQDTAEELVVAIKPHIYVKGGDYTSDRLPEARVVTAYGGEVRILPLTPGISTSDILRRIVERLG
ncbi:MAG: D-glycero-beta-D-manno-heptose 1-phosphate adenylyltransferase [Chloroflexi bacterium]|nr:D-glycero-beta-D-manno-heptose 1-phosphate adenylyltransferase [Chloroflexota bacterium]